MKPKIISKCYLILVAVKNKAIKKLDKFVEAEPQVKSEYIDKVIYLLRKDFNIQDQNEIVLAIGQKLHELRDKDMRKMESEMENLKEHTALFKARFIAI